MIQEFEIVLVDLVIARRSKQRRSSLTGVTEHIQSLDTVDPPDETV